MFELGVNQELIIEGVLTLVIIVFLKIQTNKIVRKLEKQKEELEVEYLEKYSQKFNSVYQRLGAITNKIAETNKLIKDKNQLSKIN